MSLIYVTFLFITLAYLKVTDCEFVTLLRYNIIFFRSINDVDKTMDEINEQTETMKQIQDALAAPIGADFDEVISNNNIYLHSANEILSFD
jgi:hypothetical protein